jgi:hypothetical protein
MAITRDLNTDRLNALSLADLIALHNYAIEQHKTFVGYWSQNAESKSYAKPLAAIRQVMNVTGDLIAERIKEIFPDYDLFNE